MVALAVAKNMEPSYTCNKYGRLGECAVYTSLITGQCCMHVVDYGTVLHACVPRKAANEPWMHADDGVVIDSNTRLFLFFSRGGRMGR